MHAPKATIGQVLFLFNLDDGHSMQISETGSQNDGLSCLRLKVAGLEMLQPQVSYFHLKNAVNEIAQKLNKATAFSSPEVEEQAALIYDLIKKYIWLDENASEIQKISKEIYSFYVPDLNPPLVEPPMFRGYPFAFKLQIQKAIAEVLTALPLEKIESIIDLIKKNSLQSDTGIMDKFQKANLPELSKNGFYDKNNSPLQKEKRLSKIVEIAGQDIDSFACEIVEKIINIPPSSGSQLETTDIELRDFLWQKMSPYFTDSSEISWVSIKLCENKKGARLALASCPEAMRKYLPEIFYPFQEYIRLEDSELLRNIYKLADEFLSGSGIDKKHFKITEKTRKIKKDIIQQLICIRMDDCFYGFRKIQSIFSIRNPQKDTGTSHISELLEPYNKDCRELRSHFPVNLFPVNAVSKAIVNSTLIWFKINLPEWNPDKKAEMYNQFLAHFILSLKYAVHDKLPRQIDKNDLENLVNYLFSKNLLLKQGGFARPGVFNEIKQDIFESNDELKQAEKEPPKLPMLPTTKLHGAWGITGRKSCRFSQLRNVFEPSIQPILSNMKQPSSSHIPPAKSLEVEDNNTIGINRRSPANLLNFKFQYGDDQELLDFHARSLVNAVDLNDLSEHQQKYLDSLFSAQLVNIGIDIGSYNKLVIKKLRYYPKKASKKIPLVPFHDRCSWNKNFFLFWKLSDSLEKKYFKYVDENSFKSSSRSSAKKNIHTPEVETFAMYVAHRKALLNVITAQLPRTPSPELYDINRFNYFPFLANINFHINDYTPQHLISIVKLVMSAVSPDSLRSFFYIKDIDSIMFHSGRCERGDFFHHKNYRSLLQDAKEFILPQIGRFGNPVSSFGRIGSNLIDLIAHLNSYEKERTLRGPIGFLTACLLTIMIKKELFPELRVL